MSKAGVFFVVTSPSTKHVCAVFTYSNGNFVIVVFSRYNLDLWRLMIYLADSFFEGV